MITMPKLPYIFAHLLKLDTEIRKFSFNELLNEH